MNIKLELMIHIKLELIKQLKLELIKQLKLELKLLVLKLKIISERLI